MNEKGSLIRSRVVMVLEDTINAEKQFRDTTDGTNSMRMSTERWEHFGEPQEVTVTVRPGNRLQAERLAHDPNWKFAPTDPGCGLETFIGEAVGAASMCWETPEDAGVFDSTRASAIVDAIYTRAMAPSGARLGMATTKQLLRELEVRISSEDGYADVVRRLHMWQVGGLAEEVLNYRTVDSNE